MIHFIEAFDVVRNALSLQDLLALRDGSDGVYLQIWEEWVKDETPLGKPHEVGLELGRGGEKRMVFRLGRR